MIRFVVAAVMVVGAALPASATISYTTIGTTIPQNFDTLSTTTGTNVAWTNNSTLPGWYLFNSSGAAITTYRASNGGENTGAFYSFGSTANDRALGGVASGGTYFGSPVTGAVAGWIAVGFTNNSPLDWGNFTVAYNGEQWRNGGNTTAQSMVFEYGIGATFAGVTTWTAPGGAFDYASPVTGATAATVDGNAAGLVADRGGFVRLPVPVNSTLWLRWVERNDTGNDHGLAIDGFTFVAAVPEPSAFLFGGLMAGVVAFGGRQLRSDESAEALAA
jgi:hypothetical protein